MNQNAKLRVVYGTALANVAVLAIWGLLCFVPGVIRSVGAAGFELLPDAILLVSLAIAAAPLILLVLQPRWWGKLLLPVYGFAWLMNAVALLLLGQSIRLQALWLETACGLLMFGLAFAHQLIDPRSSTPRP
jgi:hypothetical protein